MSVTIKTNALIPGAIEVGPNLLPSTHSDSLGNKLTPRVINGQLECAAQGTYSLSGLEAYLLNDTMIRGHSREQKMNHSPLAEACADIKAGISPTNRVLHHVDVNVTDMIAPFNQVLHFVGEKTGLIKR